MMSYKVGYQVHVAARAFLPLILMVACDMVKTGQEDRTTKTGGLHGMAHYSRSTTCCCCAGPSNDPRPKEEEKKGPFFSQALFSFPLQA